MATSRYLLLALAIVLAGMEGSLGAQTPASPPSPPASTSEAAPSVPSSRPSETPMADAGSSQDIELQARVQIALSKVPELSNDSLRVVAAVDSLELSGTVATGKQRQAALRIAQSYARGKKVVDHIVISGRSSPRPESVTSEKASHQANSQL